MSGAGAALPPLGDRLAGARERLAELWSWWTGELAGMLPAGLRRSLAAAPQALLAEAAGDGLRLFRRDRGDGSWRPLPAGAAAPAGLPVWLRLPAGAVLVRRLEWPQMSMADLRRAILLDLDRQTPCAAEDLFLDIQVTGRDAARRRLTLALAVARRPVVEAALARLAAAGLPAPARIGATTEAPGGIRFDLRTALPAPAAAGPRRAALLPASPRARLLLLCALLGVLNLGLHAEAEARRAARLDAAVVEARQRAQRVEVLRQQIAERRRIRDSIVARRGEISLLAILEQLTRVIPDDAWLDSVEVRGSSLYVTGHAPLAVSLVPLIETSPMFADAQFRSPVTPDRSSGRERFDLSIRLRMPEP